MRQNLLAEYSVLCDKFTAALVSKEYVSRPPKIHCGMLLCRNEFPIAGALPRCYLGLCTCSVQIVCPRRIFWGGDSAPGNAVHDGLPKRS
jgi:hypothetical protein